MCTSGSHDNMLVDGPASFVHKRGRRLAGILVCAAVSVFFIISETAQAQSSDWELPAVESHMKTAASRWTPLVFETHQAAPSASTVRLVAESQVTSNQKADAIVPPAEFDQPASEKPPQLPSYLNPAEDMPQPPLLDTQSPDQSVAAQLDQLARRMDQLEKTRIAQEDATRAIIRKSFAERASNITDTVAFGGTLETLTFWQSNFDGTKESDIRLDTAELDFDITMNTW